MRMSRAQVVISWKPSHNSEARSVHDELDLTPYPPLRRERMKCQRSVHLERANRVRDALFLKVCALVAWARLRKFGYAEERAHIKTPCKCRLSLSPPPDGLA